MVKKLEVYKEIQNLGNASVNGANYVNAINPNSPNTNGMSSSQAISALSSMYGYVDSLANIGGKSLPFANTVAIGSNAYSLGATATSEKPYIATNDLLGLSSALLGAAAVGIAAAATAPAWVPVAIGVAALAAGAAGTQYKEKIDLGDLSDNISNDLNKIQEKLKETINQAAEKMGETAEDFSNAIDKMWDKAQELGERFGDWLREKFDDIGDWLDQAQKDFGEWFIPWAKDLGDWTGLNRDGKYHVLVYDPLVLDLDGDGIETVGTQGYKGALFDHDKDGIRTSTGWVAADDGLLVIDRNSDGLINNGGELFGDSTVLKDGTNAAHGYAALAEFDSNSDGKVNAQDADFAKLKVWRDLNQDGVSQEGELFALKDLNIQSLDVTYQDVNTRLGNGNTLAQKGSYTLSDGTKREMGDLLLAADHLHSRFTDSVKLTEAQMQVANVQDIWRLREAA